MLKKICSLICTVAIAFSSISSLGVVMAAEDTNSQIKYNYKLSMEGESEFRMVYGYNGGTISTKKSYVAGMYGNALQITYPGHYISDPAKRYNGFVMQFKDENIKLANESISMLDLMRDTQNISMWVHTPVTVDHSGKGAAANRTIEMNFEFATASGNVGYKKQFQLPNRGEWEYITIPVSAFTAAGAVTMDKGIQSDTYKSLSQLTIIFPYNTYFGAAPTEDTLENPWEEPFIIDEMLFDRSTDEMKAITPPSTGEEAYFENANILSVSVKGAVVKDFDKNASSNDIPVSASYTADDIRKNVTVEVEAPSVPKTNKQQELTGASYEIEAPASVPGKGRIIVTSGSRKAKKIYDVNFTALNGIQPDISGITSEGGNIKVPVNNESSGASVQACALAVVKNSSGECTGTSFAPQRNIEAGGTAIFDFSIGSSVGDDIEIYIFNNENDYKLLCAPVKIGGGLMSYTEPSGKISDDHITFTDGGETVNINGTVTNDGTVFVILKNDSGYIGAYTIDTENGILNKSIFTADRSYGKLYAVLSYGNTILRELYNAPQTEIDACIRDFVNLDADDTDNFKYFEKYKMTLNLNKYLPEKLDSSEIADAVKAAGKNISDINDIRTNIGSELIVKLINKINSAETLKEIYSIYNDIAGFDGNSSYFKKYITTDVILDKVFAQMSVSDYRSIVSVREAFNENCMLIAFNSINGYGEIEELISENRGILSKYLDYGELSNLQNNERAGFYKYVAQKGVKSLSTLNTLLSDYKRTIRHDTGKTNGIGSVSGNGSNGSNTSFVSGVTGQNVKPPPEAPKEDLTFTDVSDGHWAYSSINSLKKLGIVHGRDDGSFGIDDTVTREEFVKMLLGSFGKEPEDIDGGFSDVDMNDWYAPYVNTAADMGIVSGIGRGLFGVGEKITRQDMAVLIARYLEKEGCVLNSVAGTAFTDDKTIADYAKESVYALKNLELISGMTDGSFRPGDNATRAQSAQMLYSVYLYMKSRNISDTDLNGSDRYKLLVRKFDALNIIKQPQGENDTVTKGQFAKYITGFVNAGSVGDEIQFLYSNGYIDKNSDFTDSAPITLGEAAVVMCRIMGYDFYAVQKGVTPDSYLSTAIEYDIISLSDKECDDILSFIDLMEIFDSASRSYVVTSSLNGEGGQYNITDMTALYYFHKILVLDDIVYAVGTRTVDGGASVSDNGVRIGARSFDCGMQEAFKYLGYRVFAFYTEKDERLRFIEPHKANKVFTVKGSMISDFDGSVLKYYKDEASFSEKKETLSKSVNRLYNYNYVTEYAADDVKDIEEIIFIDNNNDGIYDTVNVINEAIYCISQITSYETTLYDYYDQTPVKLADRKSVIIYDIDEKITVPGSIKSYDVLSVIEDKQKENIIIYIAGEEVDGIVTSVSSQSEKMTVSIDNVKFELTDILATQNNTKGLCAPGNRISVLLDRNGRIAYLEADINAVSDSFAYLVKAISEEPGSRPFLRLYTTLGELEDINLAKRATINNTKIKENDNLETLFKNTNIDNNSVNQLVRYKLNSNGEIQSVKTAQYIDSDELYTTSSIFTRTADLNDSYYNALYRNFPGYARLSENTIIMSVPESEAFMSEPSHYGIRQFKDMKSETFNKVELYNLSKDMVAGFAVIKSDNGGGKQLTYSSAVAAVKEISTIAIDDDIRYALTLLYNGSEQEFITAEGVGLERQYNGTDGLPVTSTIDKGDLIRIATNAKEEITDYHKVFDFDNEDNSDVIIRGNEYNDAKSYTGSSKTMIKFNGMAENPDEDVVSGRIWQGKNPYWFTGVQYSTEFGIVKSISGSSMIIQIYPGTNGSNNTKNERYFNLTNKRVYVLEDGIDGVRLGNLDDIVSAECAGEAKASRIIISRHNDVPSIAAIVIR